MILPFCLCQLFVRFYERDLPGIAAHKSSYFMVASVDGPMAAMKMNRQSKDNISFFATSSSMSSLIICLRFDHINGLVFLL